MIVTTVRYATQHPNKHSTNKKETSIMTIMTLPLDSYAGFAQTSFMNGDKLWAALTLNKTGRDEGRYDFKGESFDIPATAMTGVIDGDNYWLIATLGSGACNKGGVFEFKSWKQGTDGNKGSFDKAKGEALALQWQLDGCNAAINVNNIPALKVFVKVLHELKIIVSNESKAITARLTITEDLCADIETSLAEFLAWALCNDVDTLDEKMPQYAHAVKLSEAGIMALPVLSNDGLPGAPKVSITGKVIGHEIKCFPFKGELPCYESVDVVLPKKEDKKGGGSGRSYTPAESTKDALEAREKFFVSSMALVNPEIKTLADALERFTDAKTPLIDIAEIILKVMGK